MTGEKNIITLPDGYTIVATPRLFKSAGVRRRNLPHLNVSESERQHLGAIMLKHSRARSMYTQGQMDYALNLLRTMGLKKAAARSGVNINLIRREVHRRVIAGKYPVRDVELFWDVYAKHKWKRDFIIKVLHEVAQTGDGLFTAGKRVSEREGMPWTKANWVLKDYGYGVIYPPEGGWPNIRIPLSVLRARAEKRRAEAAIYAHNKRMRVEAARKKLFHRPESADAFLRRRRRVRRPKGADILRTLSTDPPPHQAG